MSSERKAIGSVMVIIMALSTVFLIQTARSHRRHLNDSIQQNIDEARRIVEGNLAATRTLYRAQLRHVTLHHDDILDAFYRRERQRLYETALPVFENMKREHPGFSNMHFHLPDGRSFLRMHRPEEYGDDLTDIRRMIAHIHQDKVARDGYEIGMHGLFYRVAEPVMYAGRYLGVLEMAIQPDTLIEGIEAILGVHIALYVASSPVEGRLTRWGNDQSRPFSEWSSEELLPATPCERRTAQGRFCVYRAAAIKDFAGAEIGHLVIAQNIDRPTAQYRRVVVMASLLTLGLIAAAYIILRLSFGRMIQKIVHLNRTLEQKVRERTQELLDEKKKVEAAGTELEQIFETAAGGLRVIGTDLRTIRVNKTFKDMVGLDETEIVGKPCHETFPGPFCHTDECPLSRILHGAERVELEVEKVRQSGRVVPCLLTATPWRSPEGELLGFIEDFTDITTVKKLVEQQTINIGLAQRILSFINSTCSRYVDTDQKTGLFFKALSSTCHAAGGDHYFMRSLPPDGRHPAGRTVVSLKDQSGHEVNCILKSIATDLIHNTILHGSDGLSLAEEITRLNDILNVSTLFAPDEFVTALTVEVDHATRTLRYISCGHPPLLLVRGGQILAFPADTGPGRHLPLAVSPHLAFTTGTLPLEVGDRLIFYTDGLTEMPVARKGRRLSTACLKRLLEGIVAGHPALPVSQLISRVLDTVAEMSGESVKPGGCNTSADDVTVLGLELEAQEADVEHVLHITNGGELSECVGVFCRQIAAQAYDRGFELDERRLRAVLDETLSNAWKHGHGCDPGQPIILRWRLRNDLHIEVVDLGPGFDYHHLTDPTEGENIVRESGRGLFIVRLYADHVRWRDGGRRIIFSFRGPGELDRRKRDRIQKVHCLNIWQSAGHSRDCARGD